MSSFISVGDIKIVSTGRSSDTRVYFIDREGFEHEIRTIIDAQWHLSVEDDMPQLYLTVALPQMELTLPAEFLELFREQQIIFIGDITPWWTRVFLWWKKGWTPWTKVDTLIFVVFFTLGVVLGLLR